MSQLTAPFLGLYGLYRFFQLEGGVALFNTSAPSRSGKALFSINESSRAHTYIKWANPFEAAFALVTISAVLICFLAYGFWNLRVVDALLGQISLSSLILLVFPLGVVSLFFLYRPPYRHVCYERQLRITEFCITD